MIDRRDLIFDAVLTDAAYAGRFVSSLTRVDPGIASTAIFCMVSYLSLFIHERLR